MEVAIEIQASKTPIFIIGFSGTGKSTLGKSLAFKMQKHFFDLDSEIELLAGKPIKQIISDEGVIKFRELETQILKTLCMVQDSVVALGGGALLNSENLNKIKRTGCLIYLSSNVERLIQNLKEQKVERPLLKDLSVETIKSLLAEREPGYLQADIICEMKDEPVLESTENVYEKLCMWLKQKGLN